MINSIYYNSPLGKMLISADEIGLIGLWFAGQKYYPTNIEINESAENITTIIETKKWLDIYFSGSIPSFTPKLHLIGTEFQKQVWKILLNIPYGEKITYGRIADIIAKSKGIKHMSAQAVGGATGKNPILIIIPCHRVIASDGRKTSYVAGIEIKEKLLDFEKINS